LLEAIGSGFANDPTTPANEGPITLWNSDNYHASAYGSYLAASVFYAKILGGDPRTLPTGAGSAAAGLGLNAAYADQLQQVAYNLVQPIPEPSPALLACVGLALFPSLRRRSRSESREAMLT
jgi:MYXO-CTERM domain-containing protein